jgi:hypothetical protein
MMPMNSTPIVEEIQQPQPEAMKVNMSEAMQEPQNKEAETQKEVQPESTEESLEVNKTTLNMEATVEPNESQMTISCQPARETTEDTSVWLEWLMGEQLKAAGTSTQPPQQEDRVQIPIPPHKKPAA